MAKESPKTSTGETMDLSSSTPPPQELTMGEIAYKKVEELEKKIDHLSKEINYPAWSASILKSISLLSYTLKFVIIVIGIIICVACIGFLILNYINFKILLETLDEIRKNFEVIKDLKGLNELYFFAKKWLNVYIFGFIGLSGVSTISFIILKLVEKIKK